MESKYITYEQYTKQEDKIKKLRADGVEFIYKISSFKLLLGSACLLIAIVPNGAGVIFYPVGFALLGSAGIDICTLIQDKQRKIRVLKNRFLRWIGW